MDGPKWFQKFSKVLSFFEKNPYALNFLTQIKDLTKWKRSKVFIATIQEMDGGKFFVIISKTN